MTDKCEKILFLLAHTVSLPTTAVCLISYWLNLRLLKQQESPSDLEKPLLEERKPDERDSQFKFYLDILDF